MSKELTPTRSKNALNRSVCSETSNGSGHGTGLAEELDYTLTRIEHRIEVARYQYQCAALLQSAPTSEAPATPSRGTGIGRFLSRSMRRGDKAVISTPDQNTTSDSLASSPSFSPIRPVRKMPTGPVADFIPFPEQEEFIEDLRRVAELCVIGENFVSRMQRKQESAEERAKVRWAAARDALLEDVSESDPAYDETHVEYNEKMQLFDLFFERNALALIVDMLYGESFCVVPELTSTRGADDKNEDEQPNEKETNQPNATSIIPNSNDTTEQQENITLLPPLSIATQALQSISILIQNVSRATSLYVILSNNYMNKLINLPLNLYTTAETRRILSSPESNALPAAFASPQITEIATHFVTFLKSLAMRMNAETLQFFLTYPSVAAASQQGGNDDSHNSDTERYDTDAESMAHHEQSKDDINGYSVEFPLYSRALEFCAAHQDSFVRTTALNICLNTLRLTTIVGQENGMASSAIHLVNRSSPDGVLHNAKPLPYRERLAIARYACIPSRVEHLISPIFTKLAERWSALDEQISDIDSNKHMGYCDSTDEKGLRTEQITMAKEKVRRERLVRSFKEKVADLQDELLLLDDVFKVSHPCQISAQVPDIVSNKILTRYSGGAYCAERAAC